MRRLGMRVAVGLGVLAAGLVGGAGAASAAPGFATGNVNLRSGPGTGYPQVVVVPNSAPVEIFGCLAGYGWCDVGFNGIRGWVSSGYLQYSYEGRRVPFARYTAQAGVPVVGFEFGNYWGEHYRDRPWFADRDRWAGPPGRGPGFGPGRGPGFGPVGGREPGGDRGPGGPGGGPGYGRGPGPERGNDRGDHGFDRGPDRGPGRGPDRGEPGRGPGEFRGGPEGR